MASMMSLAIGRCRSGVRLGLGFSDSQMVPLCVREEKRHKQEKLAVVDRLSFLRLYSLYVEGVNFASIYEYSMGSHSTDIVIERF